MAEDSGLIAARLTVISRVEDSGFSLMQRRSSASPRVEGQNIFEARISCAKATKPAADGAF